MTDSAAPRTGALRPEDEGDLDRLARGAGTDSEATETEGETPSHSGVAPGAGEGSPTRMRGVPLDAEEAPSHPSLRDDSPGEPAPG